MRPNVGSQGVLVSLPPTSRRPRVDRISIWPSFKNHCFYIVKSTILTSCIPSEHLWHPLAASRPPIDLPLTSRRPILNSARLKKAALGAQSALHRPLSSDFRRHQKTTILHNKITILALPMTPGTPLGSPSGSSELALRCV